MTREGHRLMYRRLWIPAVLLLLGLTSGGVAAQEASPAADAFITPDPAECTVEPLTIAELRAALDLAPAGTPAATPSVPEGEPADADTTAAATAVVNELYACINANAFLRMFALYSEPWLISSAAGQDMNPDALSIFATPIAPQDEDERISFAVSDVTVLDDGRVRVALVTRGPFADSPESSSTVILIEQDGRWLIDGMS
jgi:hypothetical protein